LKILIVDDETISRTKLEAILEEYGECLAVENGRSAIEAVAAAIRSGAPFHLITMDVAMPGVDGMEALYEIRRLEDSAGLAPEARARIIMITAQSDRDCLITCVQAGCDDYIIKPFNSDKVARRLEALNLTGPAKPSPVKERRAEPAPEGPETDKVAIGRQVLRLFQRGEISLPSPPGIYRKFRQMVEAGASLPRIANLLKEDLAVSFHLISVSNSPFYRGVTDNRTLHQAVGRLGLDLTRKYVDLLGNRAVFTAGNPAYQPLMENLWEHSVACANAAEVIAGLVGLRTDHDPFTLGIMHDVGKMVLIQIVGELEVRGTLGSIVNREDILGTLDVYHGSFGEAVLNQWKFPPEFGLIAKLHDRIEEAADGPEALSLVQLANLAVKSMGYGYDRPLDFDLLETPPARRFNMTPGLIDQLHERITRLMDETEKSLK